MKILFDIGHPKEANIFHNIITELEKKGHTIKITATNKENTTAVLEGYGLNYEVRKHNNKLSGKVIGLLRNDLWLYKISRDFRPDIFVGATPYSAQVSRLFGKPNISISDTEIANLAIRLILPFTDVVLTPTYFERNIGEKQVRFNSYYELAYLHPDYFKPDPAVLEKMNISKNDTIILLRFSALGAHHDIGVKGFRFKSNEEMHELIKKIEPYGKVFLTSEIKLDNKLEKYRINIPTKDFHSFISYASIYIGDGASMASEAAILGIPSIYISTSKRGYLNELEKVYGLAYTFTDKIQAIDKAVELLEDKETKVKWKRKKEKLLREKIDVTKFLVDFIENYPDSLLKLKKD